MSVLTTRNALKNTIWLFSEKIFAMGLSLVTTIVVARQLGPEIYGTWSAMLATVALAAPLMTMGLNAIVTRELIQAKHSEQTILGNALLIRVGGVAVGALLVLGLSYLFVETLRDNISTLAILVLGNSFTALYLFDFWFQSQMKSRYSVVIRLTPIAISSIAKILCAYYLQSITYLAIITGIEWLATGLLFFTLYQRISGNRLVPSIDYQYARSLLKESWWLILSGLSSIIYLKIDQLMLAEMVGAKSVGLYAVSTRLTEVWFFFATAVVLSFFPKVVKSRIENTTQYERELGYLLGGLFWFGLLIAFGISLISVWAVNILFGTEFSAAGQLLAFQIWCCSIVFMREVASKWMIAESLTKYSLLSHGLGAILNVLLNLQLIPLYQSQGAVLATLASYFCAGYLVFWLSSKTQPIAKLMTKAPLTIVLFATKYLTARNR